MIIPPSSIPSRQRPSMAPIGLLVALMIASRTPAVAAEPVIGGVSGTVATGQVLTISGTNLVQDNIAAWDPFFTTWPAAYGFEGPTSAISDGYNLGRAGGTYVTNVKLMGNKSVKFHSQGAWPAGPGGLGDYVGVNPTVTNGDTGEIWVRFYCRWNLISGSWPSNYMKIIDSQGGPVYQYYLDMAGTASGQQPTYFNASYDGFPHNVPIPGGSLKNNRWYTIEIHWKTTAPNSYQLWVDGKQLVNTTPVQTATVNYLLFGIINLAGTTSTFSLDTWFDGLAFGSSRIYPAATVEIGNSPTYGQGTRNYQEPVYLSDGSVQIKADLSGLGSGPYYLWVTNNRQERSSVRQLNTSPANQPPVASAQSVSTPASTAKAITLSATDADGNALTYAIVANPAHGTLSGSGASRTYTPTAGYTGTDSFTFKANDGKVDSNVATVSITVTAVNHAPVASAQSVSTPASTAKAITLSATDADGNALTYAIVANPAHGTLSGSGASRTYTPTAGYTGTDSFTFKANDGTVDSNVATVSIAVTPAANAAPVVSVASANPATVTGKTTALTATASDDAGEAALTYTWSATGPAAVTFSANGSNAAKASTATFSKVGSYVLTVTARDAGGLTGSRTVGVTVSATAQALSISPTGASVQPNRTVAFTAVVADQFGAALTSQPTLTWTVSGGGTISSSGVFVAGAGTKSPSGGIVATTYVVTASGGGQNATSLVTVSEASTATATTGGGCGAGGAVGLLAGLGAMLGLRRRRR